MNSPMEDAVKEESDLHQAVKIEKAALVIPVSSDILYYLTGSGLILRNENFSYISDKEIRTSSLSWTNQEPRVTLTSFSKIALAANDFHSEDFLKWEGVDALETITPPTRTQEAVEHEPTEPQEGGLEEEGGTVNPEVPEAPEPEAKHSSLVAEEPKIWTTSNIEDFSAEELFALRTKLIDPKNAIGTDTEFVWFEASGDSGYLIQTDVPQEAFDYISQQLGLSPEDVEAEATVLTGQELVEYIDSLLSTGE